MFPLTATSEPAGRAASFGSSTIAERALSPLRTLEQQFFIRKNCDSKNGKDTTTPEEDLPMPHLWHVRARCLTCSCDACIIKIVVLIRLRVQTYRPRFGR